jgi:nucleoside 2-deoxyribosyltransferase
LKEKLIAYCDACTRALTIANDREELERNIAQDNKCKNCGETFGFTHDGRPYNGYIRKLSSPYFEEYFSDIKESLEKFQKDFPNPEKVVFIMMKIPDDEFSPEEVNNNEKILKVIADVLKSHGFTGIRADYKDYHSELLPNVMTYMEGCEFGIAVFEDFNPNVSFETGYMMSNGKPICFLKEKNLSNLHIDIISKLYKDFDSSEPKTIGPVLEKWLKDNIL